MSDRERYTAEELARLSDAEMVRRELDAANRQWLGVLLVAFAVLGLVSLIADAVEGPVPGRIVAAVFASIGLNLLALAALRRTRRNLTAWVLLFCVVQFLVAVAPLHRWAFAGIFALLLARFRLPAPQTLGLFAFIAAAAGALAWLRPLPPPNPHFSSGETTRFALVINLFLILAAAALQLVSTRRVRAEIVDEWREPLRNAREQVRMRDELRYAREMQLAMLPEAPPRLEWLDVAAVSIPAAEVGGDYYDFFEDGERLAIVACDVAGHGMQSGLVLAAMRGGLIAMLKRSIGAPTDVLAELHDLVTHASRRRMLAAAVVVLFDRKEMRATIASAAHPPVILRRGTETRLIEAFAPPLGVRLPFTSGAQSLDLQPGDVLVIHSDGVYESRNGANEEYGLERLQALVAAQPANATAEALRDAIVQDVERFRGRAQDDDVTVVVARVVPHDRIGNSWI